MFVGRVRWRDGRYQTKEEFAEVSRAVVGGNCRLTLCGQSVQRQTLPALPACMWTNAQSGMTWKQSARPGNGKESHEAAAMLGCGVFEARREALR